MIVSQTKGNRMSDCKNSRLEAQWEPPQGNRRAGTFPITHDGPFTPAPGFGLMRLSALILAFASLGYSQISIQYTAQPKSVPASQIADLHSLIRYEVSIRNLTAGTPRVLYLEDVTQNAPQIPFMTMSDAELVMNGAIQRSTPAVIVAVGADVLKAAAFGVSFLAQFKSSKTALKWAGGLSLAGNYGPDFISIAQGHVPTATALIDNTVWPLSLAPPGQLPSQAFPAGCCLTVHAYATKKNKTAPAAIKVIIP